MKYTTIVDIGSSKVMCLTAGSGSDGAIVVSGIGMKKYRGYRLGSLPSVGALSDALEGAIIEARQRSGIRARSICVGVPAPFTKTVLTSGRTAVESRGSRITARDMDMLLESSCIDPAPAGYELMHSTPFEFTLDGMPLDTPDGEGWASPEQAATKKAYSAQKPIRKTATPQPESFGQAPGIPSPIGLRAYTLGARIAHTFVRTDFRVMVSDILRTMGITADPFVSSSMAGALFTIPYDKRRNGALLIDCGGRHCDVSLILENALVLSESIGIGGEHITNDLAMAFRIPYASADELKRRYVCGQGSPGGLERVHTPSGEIVLIGREDLSAVIDARTNELGLLLFETICDAIPNLSFDTPVFLTGCGMGAMGGGADCISACIGRDVTLTGPKDTACLAPAFGLAQFMLFGSGASVRNNGRIINNIKELFIS